MGNNLSIKGTSVLMDVPLISSSYPFTRQQKTIAVPLHNRQPMKKAGTKMPYVQVLSSKKVDNQQT